MNSFYEVNIQKLFVIYQQELGGINTYSEHYFNPPNPEHTVPSVPYSYTEWRSPSFRPHILNLNRVDIPEVISIQFQESRLASRAGPSLLHTFALRFRKVKFLQDAQLLGDDDDNPGLHYC